MPRKYSRQIVFVILFVSIDFLSLGARAQYWHAMAPVSGNEVSAQFSEDGKRVFFLKFDAGVGNVWSEVILDKYGGVIAGKSAPVPVTHFSGHGIERFLHLLNKSDIVFMRLASGKDYHIYRMKDDGTGDAQDLTPGAAGVTNEIVGASANGWYIYYTNNALHSDKLDLYRYDTRQYTSDIVFPNDNNYRVLAWTKDQARLVVEDTTAHSLMFYDIETTSRTPIALKAGAFGLFDPMSGNVDVFPGTRKGLAIDYSANLKYSSTIQGPGGSWNMVDLGTQKEVPLPPESEPLAVSPKENFVLFSHSGKLYLYDIVKSSSIEIASF
ncbi:MAG TPA: hypothetical protein VGM92_00330 [Candidatus Kapabacteria bacterium]|jgi:Tol biopolymer transport system component